MKKIILVLFLFLCFGCVQEPVKEKINANDSRLNESLVNFFQTDTKTYVQGEHFQIKILPIYKVCFDDEAYDTSYSFYRYQVLIAPTLNETILLKDITFKPDQHLDEYYASTPMGRNGLKESQFELDKVQFPKKENIDEFVAYQMDFTISNMGDDYLSDSDISPELFDEYMQTLVFTIKYNNSEEMITVKSCDELIVIENEKQLENNHRDDIKDLFYSGATRSYFGPY